MSESAGKRGKMYVDHPKYRSKLTFLIHGPGHLLDEFKVLGYFGIKYYKFGPTKYHRQETATKKKLGIHQ